MVSQPRSTDTQGNGLPDPRRVRRLPLYSRADESLAAELQTAIERLARPWNRVCLSRLFRDRTGLAADPSLRAAIESALDRSRWFILLASPVAAASRWVGEEVRWWVANRGADRMLIVLADGELTWDQSRSRFDPDRLSAIPSELLTALSVEPPWGDASWSRGPESIDQNDARLVENAADVTSAIRGVRRDELHGAAVREARRTKG
jgi:hypothetical protein